ncbi:MAG TPA: tetrahydrofolate dehydrogenase/cyclohydrolase catalytic domain-containing protein [Spirochaetia bacterium]|nr:tetrahydrofolate dehydrogenase/cyclohydrolase catalytic domain-containing protein [Spirochaetia bacterium]
MPQLVLDGKKEAEKRAVFLEESERLLGKSLLILQCDGHSEESTYVRLKREMGERLGVLVTVSFARNKEELREMIEETNSDEIIDGVLVQLPIVGATKEETEQILSTINPEKDIDGLNPKSKFIPAVVGAVEIVLDIFNVDEEQTIAIVGSLGMVGRRLLERLKILGYQVTGLDKGDDLMGLKKYEVIIGVTGVESLIKGEMVENGFVGIDLGYPKGNFAKDASKKALMITPVPGGVGPLTIVSLFENLADI